MNDNQQQANIRSTFNAVSSGYDHPSLKFFPESAAVMADLLELRGDERVLDVATGTGNVALTIAARVPDGSVLGVDFANGMLEQARAKTSSLNINNVEFAEMDMRELALPEGGFDVATCGFGIFFVEDMGSQIRKIASAVRPGGRIAITGFGEGSFDPEAEIFFARLAQYGIKPPTPGWKHIATENGCRHLFQQAGVVDVRWEQRDMGYFLASPDAWWQVVWNGGFRGLVNQLSPEHLERFRQEHLAEIGKLATADGIRMEVDVLFTVGTKP